MPNGRPRAGPPAGPSGVRKPRAPPPEDYDEEYEDDIQPPSPPPPRPRRNEAMQPAKGAAKGAKQQEYEEAPPAEPPKNPFQKLASAIDALPPGQKMLYTMFTNTLALVLVTLIGGLIFSGLERKTAMAVNQEYIAFMTTLQSQLSMVPNGNATYATLIGNYLDDPTQVPDFWGVGTHTLYLFAFTIVTTIGYGSFAPKTSGGMIFCIVYALLAVPVGAICLGKVAGTLLELMEWSVYCLHPRVHRAKKQADKDGQGILDYEDMRVALGEVQSQDIDKQAFMKAVKELDPEETHVFSIGKFTMLFLKVDTEEMQEARNGDRAKVCSILVIGWLLLGTFVFKNSEGWTFVEGLYFCIVTLTTIGFGDYVPGSTTGDNFHLIYCIFGLGLVATFLSSISAMLSAGGGDEEEIELPPEMQDDPSPPAEEYAENPDYSQQPEDESYANSRYGEGARGGLPVMSMAVNSGNSRKGQGSGRYRPDAPAGAKPSGGDRGNPPQADANPLNMMGTFFGGLPNLFAWPAQPATPPSNPQMSREPSAAPPPRPQQPQRPPARKMKMKPVAEDDY